MARVIDLRPLTRAVPLTLAAPPALASAALATWRGRMQNEHGAARVFEALARQLERAGLDGHEECRAFAHEERRHGVLCGAVVEALGGRAVFDEAEPEAMPDHPGVTRAEAALRNVLSVCCLSETVAVALIGAERLAMPAGPLREVLEQILADEIGHARLGWKLLARELPALDRPAVARLSSYLAVAFAHLERHELAHLAPGGPLDARPDQRPDPASAALGLCDGSEMRALFRATVDSVIVPRLNSLGLDASAAWARRSAAPTCAEVSP